ncbi:hypothetical protein JCM8547_008628 [Rhodosporidiobolus lusitaniae]
MATASASPSSSSSVPSPLLHSTSALLSSLSALAHSSLNDHIDEYADAHRWIESFFDKLEHKGTVQGGQPRPAMSELMKTPGRKRVVGASTTNSHLASSKKDPVATLLFPAPSSASKKASPSFDKENSPAAATRIASPRGKMLSPLGSGKQPKALSPLRLGSPRPVLSPARSTSTPVKSAPTPAPEPEPIVIAHDFAQDDVEDVFGTAVHDLSNVMEEDEEDVEAVVEKKEEKPAHEDVLEATEEEKANLSIIGEEAEEEEEEESNTSAVTAPTTLSLATQSSIVAETQFSQPAPPSPAALPVHTSTLETANSPLSPQQLRSVSGASSVAPEADGDTAVPLNDAPSALRSAQSDSFSSSVPASANTRTPGNTTRFGAGSYSAAKLGMGSVGLGSSPPVAPSTTGKPLASARTSTGGNGARLNFVGLPKKSLGLGLGLGRNWNAGPNSSSQVSDSQESSQGNGSSLFSQPASQATQATTAPALSAQNSVFETAQTGSTTATGATKRKSLNGPDAANKTAKLSPAPQTAQEQEQEEARKRREALHNRLHSMQARQSTAAGRTSNVAGPFGANMFSTAKPLGGPSSSLFLPLNAGPLSKPLSTSTSAHFVSTSTSVTPSVEAANPLSRRPSVEAANPLSRRPSVMERVKSFEQTATQDHLHPPSPSKIPAAFARPTSPKLNGPLSSRGFASPPASPRPLTRSATSGLPLATFASPKATALAPPLAGLGFGSPKLGAPAPRSPPPAAAPAEASPGPVTISSVLSPPSSKSTIRAPTPVATANFVPPAITVKPTLPPAPVVRSTTPDGTPPPAEVQKALTEEEGEQDELDEDEDDDEEVEEILSIRAVNASIPPTAVVVEAQAKSKAVAAALAVARELEAKQAAEQAARDLEEQEAEYEREQQLKKRLPSLPEAKPLTPDSSGSEEEEGREEDQEMSEQEVEVKKPVAPVVATATKENLNVKASPSKIKMPGTFGAAMASAAKNSVEEEEEDDEEDDEDEEEGEVDEEDRTTMSMASQATTATFNFTSHSQQPFKPVKPQLAKQGSKTSLASSISSTSALSLNRSVGNGASGLKKPEPKKVSAIQRAAAAAKKEKEERDRKAALREEKRVALEKKKQDEDRKVKVETLEKKRKEREEAATKAKANTIRGVKPKTADEEPAKKRKIEPEQKTRSEIKKAPQSSRPLTASASSQHVASLTSSQNARAMGPPSSTLNKSAGPSRALNKSHGMLNKSAGASAMIGTKFMSAQIRLPDAAANAQAGPSRPAPTVPKPFSVSQGALRPPQQAAPTPAKKVEEVYQELPEIDSEYSDSDDEEAHNKKVAAMPRWAQSPALSHALYEQRKVNPDDIFGPIPPLSIQEIFRDSSSAARLRARTSSAQWDGTDALSQTDMARYHRAMGFTTGLHLQKGNDESRH